MPENGEPPTVELEQVGDGLYVASHCPTELLQTGDYMNRQDFVVADEGLRIPKGNGMRTFNFIVLGLAGEHDLETVPWRSPLRPQKAMPNYWRMYYMLHNPDEVKAGSRDRVLLATQAVHAILEEVREDPKSWAIGRRGKQVLDYVLHDVELVEV